MVGTDDTNFSYRFGEYTLDLDRGALFKGHEELRLRPKSYDVLLRLVEGHGRLVTREELLESVWGHPYGSDASLTQCLIEIRRTLGDEAHEIIRTVPRRGFVFELPVTQGSTGGTDTATERVRRIIRARLAVIGVLVLAVLVLGWWSPARFGWLPPESQYGEQSTEPTSIAVLPFLDLSRAQNQEYFADGLTDELLHALTRIPDLRVIARTSSFAFKNKDVGIPKVASQLDVTHVVEGSVKMSGETIRITAQLIDAKTNSHLWSRTYDRELKDIFEVQSEIAQAVADTLEVTLSESQQEAIARRHDPAAYEHYLRARFFWHRRALGDMERSERHYQRAVEIDPEFARAWTGLAGRYMAQTQDPARRHEAIKAMRVALDRALTINPDLPEAHARAFAYYLITDNEVLTQRHWEAAKRLGENDSLVTGYRAGQALNRGKYDLALRLNREQASLNPLSAVSQGNLGSFLMTIGEYQKAESAFKRAIDLNSSMKERHERELNLIKLLQGRYEEAITGALELPGGPDRDQLLAMGYYETGRTNAAEEALRRLEKRAGSMAALRVAEVHSLRGNADGAFEWLNRIPERVSEMDAIRQWPLWKTLLRASPCLRPLRNDPRWEPTVANMPDYPPIEAGPLQASAQLGPS